MLSTAATPGRASAHVKLWFKMGWTTWRAIFPRLYPGTALQQMSLQLPQIYHPPPGALYVGKEFGDLAKSQMTFGQNHQTPTHYRQYNVVQVVALRFTDYR
jgi:hypothetical protein